MNIPDLSVIEKVLNNCASSSEIHSVLTWFKTEEGQKWLSARMDKEEQYIILGQEEELINQKIHSDRIYRRIMHKMHSIKIKRWGLRIAAALIPFILMAAIYTQVGTKIDFFAQSEFDEVTVPSGEHLQLLFQDGSKVYLNSNSHIRYPKKFSFFERKVYLEGEAWFEVSKEDNWPFVVDLNCLKVKVLGTKFNIKAYPGDENVNVALKEGKVNLELASSKIINLAPGEKAIYNRTTNDCLVKTYDTNSKQNDWRTSKLIFKDTPLEEVLRVLSSTYHIHFKIEDEYLYKYTYTLTSDKKNLYKILNELEKITPIAFAKQGDTFFVYQKNK